MDPHRHIIIGYSPRKAKALNLLQTQNIILKIGIQDQTLSFTKTDNNVTTGIAFLIATKLDIYGARWINLQY